MMAKCGHEFFLDFRAIISKFTWHFRMGFFTQITRFLAGSRHVQCILAFSVLGELFTANVLVHAFLDRICGDDVKKDF